MSAPLLTGGAYRTARPRITWGTSYANVLAFGVPLDNAIAYRERVDGSVTRRMPSGAQESWTYGTHSLLSFEVGWIPATTDGVATGWDDVAGWDAFLRSAWRGGAFRFYPDASDTATFFDAQLVSPHADEKPDPEPDFSRRLAMVIRRADGEQITGYAAEWRARLYAPRSVDLTEATLMTCDTGAHADVFAISTLPDFTDGTSGITYRGYMGQPTGRTAKIDPRERTTDKGEIRIPVLDPRLDRTDIAVRWATSFIGNARGKLKWHGAKWEVDRSTDGGLTWQPWWTGRTTASGLLDETTYQFTVRDNGEEWEGDVFCGAPHPSITGVTVTQLWPIGFFGNYGGFLRDTTLPPCTRASDTTITGFRPQDARGSICKGLADLADYQSAIARFSFGGLTFSALYYSGDQVRVLIPGASQQWKLREIRVICAAPDQYLTGGVPRLSQIIVDKNDGPLPAGPYALVQLVSTQKPSSAAPLLISQKHPVQLTKEILEGKYGYFDTGTGAPLRSIAYNVTNISNLIADDSFGLQDWVVDDRAVTLEWWNANVGKPNGLAYRWNAAGEFELADLRMRTAVLATTVLADGDTVAGGGMRWTTDMKDAITTIYATYHVDQQVGVGGVEAFTNGSGDPATFPDASAALVRSADVPLILIDNQDVARDIGDFPVTVDYPNRRAFAPMLLGQTTPSDVPTLAEDIAIQRIVRALRESLFDLHTPFEVGSQTAEALILPSSASKVTVGAWVICEMTAHPVPGISARAGSRFALITSVDEQENLALRVGLFLVGGGPKLDPPTVDCAFATGADTLQLPVTLDAANDPVVMNWAATPTSVTVRPADTDARWQAALFDLFSSGDFAITAPPDSRIWFRARSVPTADTIASNSPSDWAYPSGTCGPVDTAPMPAPTTLVAAPGADCTQQILTWTNTSTTLRVLVELQGPTDADFVPLRVLQPGSMTFTLTGLLTGAAYTAAVRYVQDPPYAAKSARATATFTTCSTVPTLPVPTRPVASAGSVVAQQWTATYAVTSQASGPVTLSIEMAIETAVGSGTVTGFTEIDNQARPLGMRAVLSLPEPLDGLTRYFRARHKLGTAASAYCEIVSCIPSSVLDPGGPPPGGGGGGGGGIDPAAIAGGFAPENIAFLAEGDAQVRFTGVPSAAGTDADTGWHKQFDPTLWTHLRIEGRIEAALAGGVLRVVRSLDPIGTADGSRTWQSIGESSAHLEQSLVTTGDFASASVYMDRTGIGDTMFGVQLYGGDGTDASEVRFSRLAIQFLPGAKVDNPIVSPICDPRFTAFYLPEYSSALCDDSFAALLATAANTFANDLDGCGSHVTGFPWETFSDAGIALVADTSAWNSKQVLRLQDYVSGGLTQPSVAIKLFDPAVLNDVWVRVPVRFNMSQVTGMTLYGIGNIEVGDWWNGAGAGLYFRPPAPPAEAGNFAETFFVDINGADTRTDYPSAYDAVNDGTTWYEVLVRMDHGGAVSSGTMTCRIVFRNAAGGAPLIDQRVSGLAFDNTAPYTGSCAPLSFLTLRGPQGGWIDFGMVEIVDGATHPDPFAVGA